jgi:hypothetical protein
MEDIIVIDRNAVADLVKSIEILTLIIQGKIPESPLTEEEESRLKYVNKCVEYSMQSFEKHNP